MSRTHRWISRASIAAFLACSSALPLALADEAALAPRRDASLAAFAKRELRQGAPSPQGWVDTERWCVAHACLATNTRLEEANRYLAEIIPVSVTDGLIADTDVQVTDLLRSYLQFKDKGLSPAAKANLEKFFGEWRVPNDDRNRRADVDYEWPCEYTENHTLNILVGAYLIDTALGRDRTARRALLQRFFLEHAKWGWSEFHSPNYGMVTAKALTCLYDFAPDKQIAEAARMTLDVLAIEYANQSIGMWRGIPFVRGAGRETSNSSSFYDLARYWFTPAGKPFEGGDGFLPHLLTSKYRPPVVAEEIISQPEKRGQYMMHGTVTHGPARQRIPIEVWVSPFATIASAQGTGHFYNGCYWSISFASAMGNVVTGNYGNDHNILQRGNVLATFGTVTWHGGLKPVKTESITIGGDDNSWVGQIDLAEDAHVIMVSARAAHATPEAFKTALAALKAEFKEGTLSWTMPDGRAIQMINERDGKRWRMVRAFDAGKLIRTDTNLLYGSPIMQSVRGSAVIEIAWAGKRSTYDFRDVENPRVIAEKDAALSALPAEEVDGPLGMKMMHVGAGDFVLGSGPGEGRTNERPQRWVELGGYYISRTEVTYGQWKQYLAENPTAPKPPESFAKNWRKTDEYPMSYVTWNEAKAFCDWLTKKSGKKYSLPTEAQWEKAAKGYTHRVYPWGATYDATQSGTPNTTYAAVAVKATDISPFGVMDMAGNVFEWCADWYDPAAYSKGPDVNPTGPEKGTERVLRGCGWNFDPDTFRCSYRSRYAPTERGVNIGFRVVREE